MGMIGLGVMGRNFLLNIAEKGISIAGYDNDKDKVALLRSESISHANVSAFDDLKAFVASLKPPKTIILLVPAGIIVDEVIKELVPMLKAGDIIADGGNSHFKDTIRRQNALAEKGIYLLGVGISGGEKGARRGPCIMPGGDKKAYGHLKSVFEASSASFEGEPCVAYLGPSAAGHYVKMIHNGIEYGLMQLISEAYDLMLRGMSMHDAEIHAAFAGWAKGELGSYLIEITAEIFARVDERTGFALIDEIADVAKQKGTGIWTQESALELEVPIPTIDYAVGQRFLSALQMERHQASKILATPIEPINRNKGLFIEQLSYGLYVGMLITFSQGMSLMQAASRHYHFEINLLTVSRIWRDGCIIRAKMLEEICRAYEKTPHLPNLLLDDNIAGIIALNQDKLRSVISTALFSGIPIGGFMSCLSYLDSLRSSWLPMNLVQAQRDFFGAHTYERLDAKGSFHTNWERI